jgi:hypothetical protein
MSRITCSGCGARFEGDEFGESVGFLLHDCEGAPLLPIRDGESFEDWQARCDCLSTAEVRTVKRAARYMGLGWQAEVARPVSARRLCELVDRLGVEAGCDEWSRVENLTK